MRGPNTVPFERLQFARALRQQMTRAEAIPWSRLRGSRLNGVIPRLRLGLDPGIGGRSRSIDTLSISTATPPSSWSNWTASNTRGSQVMTQGEPRSFSGSVFGSFASRTQRSAMMFTPFLLEFAPNCF